MSCKTPGAPILAISGPERSELRGHFCSANSRNSPVSQSYGLRLTWHLWHKGHFPAEPLGFLHFAEHLPWGTEGGFGMEGRSQGHGDFSNTLSLGCMSCLFPALLSRGDTEHTFLPATNMRFVLLACLWGKWGGILFSLLLACHNFTNSPSLPSLLLP